MSDILITNKDNGKKPVSATAGKSSTDVNLKVISQRWKTVHFRMRRDTPLQELIDVYSKIHKEYSLRFLYNGGGINPKLTALQSGMKDGDEIDAMLHVHGGGSTF